MDNFSIVLKYMPKSISSLLCEIPIEVSKNIEEIRLREKKPLLIYNRDIELFINNSGKPCNSIADSYIVQKSDIDTALQLISNFSIYSVEDELKNGFITIEGGNRVGLSGKAIIDSGKVKTLKNISCINYRIAREVLGSADRLIDYIVKEKDEIYNTLIISPPQCGKTTLLRDIIRQLSNRGKKVSLIDERSEIAASYLGVARNDIGIRTDVLDGCPKAIGIIMMIRSMSPQIIATDEIGKVEDGFAIMDAINSGVKIITTIHGSDIEDFLRKSELSMLHSNVFERIVVLNRKLGPGTIDCILDENFLPIVENRYYRRDKNVS